MITVVWWFLYRRWKFKQWTRDTETLAHRVLLLSNAYKVNLCSCRDHRVIHRDMQRILK